MSIYCRVLAVVAGQPHKLKVVGSSPISASTNLVVIM